jgi:hypothetical protein
MKEHAVNPAHRVVPVAGKRAPTKSDEMIPDQRLLLAVANPQFLC